ncbi:MAG: M48 family metallopeptidase [Acidobacteriota bacterium]
MSLTDGGRRSLKERDKMARLEMKRSKHTLLILIVCFHLGLHPVDIEAQTKVKPGFNIFSEGQDVEIGRESAAEVERQMPILHNNDVQAYVEQIGKRLVAVVPGPRFPYQFKVVNVSDINAFALPGGFMYVNRGLIEAAKSEGELAGVMAHEISHVALRHGTNQASKAYLAQAGLGVLGGLLGGGGAGSTSQIVGAVGGFGLNAVFLKFSRNAEEQADILGAQMLARAGYDPMDMASMFETLREQSGRDPGKLEQFFSSHPAPANRAQRIREETKLIGSFRTRPPVGDFPEVRRELQRLPAAPSMQQLANRQSSEKGSPQGQSAGDIRIERPSSRFATFRQRDRAYEISYPDNWRPHESSSGYGVTIIPEGGVVRSKGGQESIVFGAIINQYTPFEGSVNRSTARQRARRTSWDLGEATWDLVAQLLDSNRHLRVVDRSERRQRINGDDVVSLVLSGDSPITGTEERVTVYTRELNNGTIMYSLFVAPGRDYRQLDSVFQKMVSSWKISKRFSR